MNYESVGLAVLGLCCLIVLFFIIIIIYFLVVYKKKRRKGYMYEYVEPTKLQDFLSIAIFIGVDLLIFLIMIYIWSKFDWWDRFVSDIMSCKEFFYIIYYINKINFMNYDFDYFIFISIILLCCLLILFFIINLLILIKKELEYERDRKNPNVPTKLDKFLNFVIRVGCDMLWIFVIWYILFQFDWPEIIRRIFGGK